MFKVVITGAECSGKTTLAKELAELFNTTFIPEYARMYIDQLNRKYQRSDLLHIAQKQHEIEKERGLDKPKILICDTSLLVIKVWSMIKYKKVDSRITELLSLSQPDLYILPDWNIPYVKDPQRESNGNRLPIYEQYVDELNAQAVPWITVSGTIRERAEQAFFAISALMAS